MPNVLNKPTYAAGCEQYKGIPGILYSDAMIDGPDLGPIARYYVMEVMDRRVGWRDGDDGPFRYRLTEPEVFQADNGTWAIRALYDGRDDA